MSVNSVLTRLPWTYGFPSDNNSQAAKTAALAQDLPQQTFVTDVSQLADAAAGDATQNAPAGDESSGASYFQGTLEQALREGNAAARNSAGGTLEAPAGQSLPGVALYQRISQYGSSETATSALLTRWNNIMQGGQDAESTVTAFAKVLSQSQMPGFESGVLDLTA